MDKTITVSSLMSRIADNNLEDKRLYYLRTLVMKHGLSPSTTVEDLLALDIKGKKMRDLQEAILKIDYSVFDTPEIVTIPSSNVSFEPGEMLQAFVRDFIDGVQAFFEKSGSKESDMWKVDALKLKFLYSRPEDARVWENKEIAYVVKRCAEAVRKNMKTMAIASVSMLSSGSEYCGMVPSESMMNVFSAFKSGLGSIEIYNLLQKKFGIPAEDRRTLSFFLEGLNYDITFSKYDKHYCIDANIFGRSLSSLKDKAHQIEKFFKEDPRPLRFKTEVMAFLRRKGWDDTTCEQIESFLRADTSEYEWGKDSSGDETVALFWVALDSVENRLVRILYDHADATPSNPEMSREQLVGEYNKRARLFGVGVYPIDKGISGIKHIRLVSHDLYCYEHNTSVKKLKIDIKRLLYSYIENNGGCVRHADIIAYAKSVNPNYKDNTIEQYLTQGGYSKHKVNGELCWEFTNNGNGAIKQILTKQEVWRGSLKILHDARRPMSIKNELIPLFQKEAGLSNFNATSFSNMLKKQKGILFNFLDRDTVKGLMSAEEAEGAYPDFFVKTERKTSVRVRTIRTQAVETLLKAPGFTMTKKQLVDSVRSLYPKGKAVAPIYAIFSKDPIFLSSGDTVGSTYTLDINLYNKENGFGDTFNWATLRERIAGFVKDYLINNNTCDKMYEIMQRSAVKPFGNKDEMWRILKLVDTFLAGKAKESDSELLVYKLFLGIEVYLKRYDARGNGNGLGEYISSLQNIGELPSRYASGLVGVPRELNNMNGLVIGRRNNIGHNLNAGFNNAVYYEDNIKQALRYYLLIAAYDLNGRH